MSNWNDTNDKLEQAGAELSQAQLPTEIWLKCVGLNWSIQNNNWDGAVLILVKLKLATTSYELATN